MITIIRLHRAVLEALDTAERGACDHEILGTLLFGDTCARVTDRVDTEAITVALIELLDEGLIDARFRDDLADCGVSADPIIYSITEGGCDALWALMRAEAAVVGIDPKTGVGFVRPVHFDCRATMRAFLRRAA